MLRHPLHLAELIADRAERGGPDYRWSAPARTVKLQDVLDLLDRDGKELLCRYEEEDNQDTDRLVNDNFVYGYLLGASGVVDRLADAGLIDVE